MKTKDLKAVIARKNDIIKKETEKINRSKERIKAAKTEIAQYMKFLEEAEVKELLSCIKESGISVNDIKAFINRKEKSEKPEET